METATKTYKLPNGRAILTLTVEADWLGLTSEDHAAIQWVAVVCSALEALDKGKPKRGRPPGSKSKPPAVMGSPKEAA